MSKDLGSLPPLTPEVLRHCLPQKPAVLVVPGWDDDKHEQYDRIGAALREQGWFMRRVDFPGERSRGVSREKMNRDQNLKELVAAYDSLVEQRAVEGRAVAFIGFSYGGYLGALLSAQRPLQWMALRSPALYRDEDWFVPKEELDKDELDRYRRGIRSPEENAALAACKAFSGDVLLIESEDDDTVPHPAVKSYKESFTNARSFDYRLLEGADHELSSKQAQSRFIDDLLRWMNQVTGGAAAAVSDNARGAA
ncbi:MULTISPECIES: alpha/beta hydrolase [Variovorax]|uniref:alpha/beta hydrolase n=1 Tax=Variovorax TaxID=34072 RepID=UPI002859448E|nr:alpha/beta fold hydrolase [Variovorax sp. 3319]MDR6885569.1 dipeptidyl aminopeptidase/acylaminoacyl peptidase [Variovorax sp. 3319]